tara:strand:+ start:295 stop:489 length:195 start_codon:yes stop_codon:yes gene_type:complete
MYSEFRSIKKIQKWQKVANFKNEIKNYEKIVKSCKKGTIRTKIIFLMVPFFGDFFTTIMEDSSI